MMRKAKNFLNTLLGLMLLALLALTLAALFQGQQAAAPAPQPAVTATPMLPENTPMPAVLPTRRPAPTSTPMPTQLLLPACQFSGTAPAEEPAPPLEAYVFSEPQVVLTHTSAIAIADWLPDGQRLLITRRIPNSLDETIDVFNRQTEELQQYAERHSTYDAKPVWLESEQAVAFADSANKEWALRISRGKGTLMKEPAIGLDSLYLATSPDKQQLIFLPKTPGKQPKVLQGAQAKRQALAVTLPVDSDQELPLGIGTYHIAWQPDGNHIAFFNNVGFFLTDTSSRAMCEIDLGTSGEKRWALDAKWSSDGHYLALLTTVGKPIVPFIDLTLIDMNTGQLRRLNLGHQDLHAIAWAPNHHDLLVIAAPPRHEPELAHLNTVYLVDATTGNSRQILTEYQSAFVFQGDASIVWSPNGQEIALVCPYFVSPTVVQGRLCLVPVEVKQ